MLRVWPVIRKLYIFLFYGKSLPEVLADSVKGAESPGDFLAMKGGYDTI